MNSEDSWSFEELDALPPRIDTFDQAATRIYEAFDAGKIDNPTRQTLIEELYFGDTIDRPVGEGAFDYTSENCPVRADTIFYTRRNHWESSTKLIRTAKGDPAYESKNNGKT